MKKLLMCILILITVFISGCAFTRNESRIDYVPKVQSAPLGKPSSRSLNVATIADKRGVSDPTIIFNKRNLHGQTTSGSYAAEKPIADIIREGLIQSLKTRNYRIDSEKADYELRGYILDFSYEIIADFWRGTLKPKMTTRFEVIDRKSGKDIWRDTLVGRSVIDSGDYIVQSVSLTADDVISQLLEIQSFQELFK